MNEKIANYDITLLHTGHFALDGGAMFGVVPRNLWEKVYSPGDDQNRIPMAASCLLLRSAERTILIDTGNGDKWSPKLAEIYKIDNSEYSLLQSLSKHGVAPEDITDVILTHLHFDHAGGATVAEGADIVPTFPGATYHVQKDHLAWARSASPKDKASFMPENFEPLATAGVLNIIDGEGELFPGLQLRLVHGHTRALQAVLIGDEKQKLFFSADLLPLATHVRIPYVMAYDNFPLTTIAEKERLLPEAYEEKWIVCFEHDAFTPATYIASTAKGFVLGEKVLLKS